VRFAALVILFLVMAVAELFEFGGTYDDPMARTLIGFGFLIFAGLVAGEVASRLALPKITGYLIAGMICGPHMLGLIDLDVVERLRTIDNLALALIAFTAGGELRLDRMKKVGRILIGITLFQTICAFVLVGTLAFLAGLMLLPAGDIKMLSAIALALFFGLVAAANSPATTVAIVVETKAKGYLTDQILGVTVLKDVVIIFFTAMILTTCGWIMDPAHLIKLGLILKVFGESLFSVGAGIVVAALIALYLRYIRREMVLFVVATSLFIVFASEHLHLHFLLVCITAGFCVENFSKYGDELITAIERTSMTVYIIFFAIAGASINFGTLGSMWLIALALVVFRALAFAGGNWIAGTIWREPPLIKRYSWMGYLGQAGVSLGIASIVLRTFPKVGSVFYTIVVAAIAMNQIIGPITLKYLLGRAGETAETKLEGGLTWPSNA
jgi:Kef-type K+ transport system membrane component KefB